MQCQASNVGKFPCIQRADFRLLLLLMYGFVAVEIRFPLALDFGRTFNR